MMKCKRTRVEDIIFSKHDAKGVKRPYDNPLVIKLAIEGCNTYRVLIDNKSSADIMYMTTFQQMKLDPKKPSSFRVSHG